MANREHSIPNPAATEGSGDLEQQLSRVPQKSFSQVAAVSDCFLGDREGERPNKPKAEVTWTANLHRTNTPRQEGKGKRKAQLGECKGWECKAQFTQHFANALHYTAQSTLLSQICFYLSCNNSLLLLFQEKGAGGGALARWVNTLEGNSLECWSLGLRAPSCSTACKIFMTYYTHMWRQSWFCCNYYHTGLTNLLNNGSLYGSTLNWNRMWLQSCFKMK